MSDARPPVAGTYDAELAFHLRRYAASAIDGYVRLEAGWLTAAAAEIDRLTEVIGPGVTSAELRAHFATPRVHAPDVNAGWTACGRDRATLAVAKTAGDRSVTCLSCRATAAVRRARADSCTTVEAAP